MSMLCDTRVLIVSNFGMPRAAVQVDSHKIMIRWTGGEQRSFVGS